MRGFCHTNTLPVISTVVCVDMIETGGFGFNKQSCKAKSHDNNVHDYKQLCTETQIDSEHENTFSNSVTTVTALGVTHGNYLTGTPMKLICHLYLKVKTSLCHGSLYRWDCVYLKALDDVNKGWSLVRITRPAAEHYVADDSRAGAWNVQSITGHYHVNHLKVGPTWVRHVAEWEHLPQQHAERPVDTSMYCKSFMQFDRARPLSTSAVDRLHSCNCVFDAGVFFRQRSSRNFNVTDLTRSADI